MRRFVLFLTSVVVGFMLVVAITLGLRASGVHFGWGSGRAGAQSLKAGQPAVKGKGHVDFIAEGQSIPAEKPATLALHFRVDPGFHINSHTPKSDMLIATRLIVEDMTGADVSNVDFPTGMPYSFAFEPKTKLDVYTGDVTLTAHLKAKPGTYTLKAALYYQACDQAACYPPRTLALAQPFIAK